MPDLLDKIYCSEQIHIPPTFPYIMKLYCKAAIRTQPYDLLKWSAAYFKALSTGEEPPVKERIEYPPYDSPSGLTPGYIKILIRQFGKDASTFVTAQTLFKKWGDVCLSEHLLIQLIALMGAATTLNWVRFVAICAGFISKNLTQTMILICELFTEEPEGGMATVPYGLFVDLYEYLARMNCGPLTESEIIELDAISIEDDICEVAEKIRRGIYGTERDGERLLEQEEEEMSTVEEESLPQKSAVEEETVDDEDMEDKEDSVQMAEENSIESIKKEPDPSKPDEEMNRERQTEEEVKDDPDAQGDADDSGSKDDTIHDGSENQSMKGSASERISGKSVEGEIPAVPSKNDFDETATELKDTNTDSEMETRHHHTLEGLEESIRARIEKRLAEVEAHEEVLYIDEQEREFEELSSYLLGAAARVKKFTTEAIGFQIFRKYMRQEVPGIGPPVDATQISNVIDFMDFWSDKQQRMIMPRNIRHWMCPPLDQISTPEP